MRQRGTAIGLSFAALIALSPLTVSTAAAQDGDCVRTVRSISDFTIRGDAWTWWGQAKDKYQRGHEPRVGAVIVFAKTARLPLGHVGVISRIVDSRVAMITQANWSKIDGERGHAEQDVTLFDVSKDNDWSEVRVWYKGMDGLGSSTYPIYGFIYGTPTNDAPDSVRPARPAPQLTGKRPAQAPELTITAGADWRPVDRLSLVADLRYESARYEDDLNSRKLDAGVQVDARAGWSVRPGTEVYLAVENLADARIATGQTADRVTSYGAPRTVRVGLAYRR